MALVWLASDASAKPRLPAPTTSSPAAVILRPGDEVLILIEFEGLPPPPESQQKGKK